MWRLALNVRVRRKQRSNRLLLSFCNSLPQGFAFAAYDFESGKRGVDFVRLLAVSTGSGRWLAPTKKRASMPDDAYTTRASGKVPVQFSGSRTMHGDPSRPPLSGH